MEIELITKRYHNRWIGVDIDKAKGVEFIYCPLRNERQKGFSFIQNLVCLIKGESIIISYGDKAAEKITLLKPLLKNNLPISNIKKAIHNLFGQKPWPKTNFVFSHEKFSALSINEPQSNIVIRPLTADDANKYFEFFVLANEPTGETDWVKEHFLSMAAQNYAHGVFSDGRLVSVADVADMPFMADEFQELSITTLSEYKGRGYAKLACTSLIKAMLEVNICPWISTNADNTAAIKLSKSLGFEEFCDELWITSDWIV